MVIGKRKNELRLKKWVFFSSSIQGFMQKADAEKMLLQCASGTFLIRFSEGEPGGISVAWVTGEKRYVPF